MDDFFIPVKNTRISEEIVSQIKKGILEGILNPGDKLPSERELAELWEVSRVSVREALRTLEKNGLLQIKPGIGGGAFIRQIDFETIENTMNDFFMFGAVTVDHISQVRLIIEPAAAEIAALTRTEADLDELEQVLKKCNDLINSGNANRNAQISFHRTLAKVSKNPVLIANLNSVLIFLAEELSTFRPSLESFMEDQKFHEKILQSIKDKDGKMTRKYMEEHVVKLGEIHIREKFRIKAKM